MYIGPNLPESGRYKALYAQINQLKDFCRSLAPTNSVGVMTSHTALGVTRRAQEATPAENVNQFRGEWSATPDKPYLEGDLVIRGSANKSSVGWNDTDAILATGYQAGLYIARKDVDPGTPGPEEPQLATTEEFWETVSRGSWPRLTLMTKGSTKFIKLLTASAAGNVTIDLSLASHDLVIRSVEVCEGGVTKHMLVIGSASF